MRMRNTVRLRPNYRAIYGANTPGSKTVPGSGNPTFTLRIVPRFFDHKYVFTRPDRGHARTVYTAVSLLAQARMRAAGEVGEQYVQALFDG
jgi:hypothetical protein